MIQCVSVQKIAVCDTNVIIAKVISIWKQRGDLWPGCVIEWRRNGVSFVCAVDIEKRGRRNGRRPTMIRITVVK